MNYPFPIYPGSLTSGYISFNKYRKEAIRLHEYINHLKTKIKKDTDDVANLVLINVGSGGEELINFYEKNYNIIDDDTELYQWRQIHPLFIDKFIKKFKGNKKINISMLVITPDNYLQNEEYCSYFARNPIIIDEFEIIYNRVNTSEYSYINEEFNISIKINFFNCFVPNIEKNIPLINKSNELLKHIKGESCYEINTFESSLDDIEFVNDFYDIFRDLMALNNYKHNFIIVQNFATFRNLGYDPRKMFNKLYKLCIEKQILFFEWKNSKGNICSTNMTPVLINDANFILKSINYADYRKIDNINKDDNTDYIDVLFDDT